MTRAEELFTDAWTLREQGLLSPQDHDLYNYLLQLCLKSSMHVIYQSTEVLCAILGINGNALCERRKKLQSLGLIKFTAGKGPKRPPRYMIRRLSHLSRMSTKEKYSEQMAQSIPPTIKELEQYCKEQNSVIDPNVFYHYYQTRDWYVGTSRMRDWRAAIRVWELNEVKRRHPSVMAERGEQYVEF